MVGGRALRANRSLAESPDREMDWYGFGMSSL